MPEQPDQSVHSRQQALWVPEQPDEGVQHSVSRPDAEHVIWR